MDQGLKERLIGAAVLVGLGVWLIPWVLDGKQEPLEVDSSHAALRLPAPDEPLPVRSQTLTLDAPDADAKRDPFVESPAPAEQTAQPPAASPPPSVPKVAAKEPPPGKEAQVARADPAPAASSTPVPPAATSPKPSPASAAKPAAQGDWVVQLGSFGDESNAKRLAQRVNTYGFKPEVSSVRSSGRAMYRVRMGPYGTRAQAEAAASSLSAHGFVAQIVAAE
jgi:DedD protein